VLLLLGHLHPPKAPNACASQAFLIQYKGKNFHCTEDDTKLTCTANTAGESFTHTISVADRINESNAEKDARLAEQAWQSQLTVTTSSLTTANTAQANATTAMNDNDSLPSKSAAIEASKQANAILLIEIHKLNELKKTDANVITVNDFNQQYRTLNTATNTLITNCTEQNLEEIWKNQLTVVTSSLTTANNKRLPCSVPDASG
jgi:hypothetical protein